MATSTTISNFDPALKQLYRDKAVEQLTYPDRPLLAMLPKMEEFGGRNLPIVTWFSHGQGLSSTFATAQTNRTQEKVEDFLLTRTNYYSVATIDGDTVEATRKDKYAFLDALKTVIDGSMKALADTLETYLFRDGTGWIGQVGSGQGSTVLTLSNIEDVVHFEVGMSVVGENDSGGVGGSLRSGNCIVTAIDRNAGTLTTDSTTWDDGSDGIASLDASDYLFREGDALAGGSTNLVVSGLEAWVPSAAPSSSSFFGVNRTSDVTRLGGQRYDGSSDPIEEALIKGQSLASREGASIDTCFLHHTKYRDLILELGSRVRYDRASSSAGDKAKISFRALEIDGDKGPIKVISANKCQSNVAWMLQMKTWELCTLGKPIRILAEDGNRMLRQSAADGYEVRIGFRGQLGCRAPGFNVRVGLSS